MNPGAIILRALKWLFSGIAAILQSRSDVRWRRLGLPYGIVALLALHAAPAQADMWRYVDARGVTHFSGTQLDKRYQLLFRGAEAFSAGTGKAVATQDFRSAARATTTSGQLTSFEMSPNYKAVKHLLHEASETHGIDYALLQALIATESGFNARAVSPKGAIGLMQLIPPTAERYGVKADKDTPLHQKLTDPRINIGAGSSYLSYLIKLFPGQIELALAAYNAGEGAVQRAGNKIPNYPETINYVKTVMQLYNQLKPVSVAAPASNRVRMEMMGGATGRGNVVSSAMVSTLLAKDAAGLE